MLQSLKPRHLTFGAMSLCSPAVAQVQVIDGRIVVNAASLTVQAQELQPFTRVVTGDQAQGLHTIQSAAAVLCCVNLRWQHQLALSTALEPAWHVCI